MLIIVNNVYLLNNLFVIVVIVMIAIVMVVVVRMTIKGNYKEINNLYYILFYDKL